MKLKFIIGILTVSIISHYSRAEGLFPAGDVFPDDFSTPAGRIAWIVSDVESFEGDMSLQPEFVDDSQIAQLDLTKTFTETTELSFALKVSTETGFDFLRFFINGVEYFRSSGNQDWSTQVYTLPAGSYTISWFYIRDSSAGSFSNTVWLDSVFFDPIGGFIPTPFPATDAVPTDFTMTVAGTSADSGTRGSVTNSFDVDNNVVFEGSSSLKADVITDSEAASIEVIKEFTEKTNVTFALKTSSEAGFDWLAFYVDEKVVAQWSGELDWTRYTYTASTAIHTFRWSYEKDSGSLAGQDTAWIDSLSFTKSDIPDEPGGKIESIGSLGGILIIGLSLLAFSRRRC